MRRAEVFVSITIALVLAFLVQAASTAQTSESNGIGAQKTRVSQNGLPNPDRYGAIAYSQSTGRYGISYDQLEPGDADADALNRCNASDCAIKVWFRNSCGALAAGDRGRDGKRRLGWAYASTRERAQSMAMAECQKRGTNCRQICWACTSNR